MRSIKIIYRELSTIESDRMNKGFDELYVEEGIDIESAERFSFVAEKGDRFIGCSSGLAFKNGENYSGWFQLTDLFVEKENRSKGLGKELLQTTEAKMASVGIHQIFLWTSGEKAIKFYERHGYNKFTEMENWYSDGSSRVGFRKNLPKIMTLHKENGA